MERPPGRAFPLLALGTQNGVAFAPEVFWNDCFHFPKHPLVFWLQLPRLTVIACAGVVRPTDTFGGGVTQEPVNGRIGELRAVASAEAPLIEETRHRLLPLVLTEQFVHELSNRRFLLFDHQLLVLPLVSEGCRASQRLPELGTDRHGRRDPCADFLALPLRHGRDHGVEEAAGWTGRVDTLGKGDQVGIVFAKLLGKLQQFLGIAGQPGEFGEDETGD
jgi:hypothetical protein